MSVVALAPARRRSAPARRSHDRRAGLSRRDELRREGPRGAEVLSLPPVGSGRDAVLRRRRTHAEIAAATLAEQGMRISAEAVEGFARKMANIGFLERALGERTTLQMERLRAERRRRRRPPLFRGELLRMRWSFGDPDAMLDACCPPSGGCSAGRSLSPRRPVRRLLSPPRGAMGRVQGRARGARTRSRRSRPERRRALGDGRRRDPDPRARPRLRVQAFRRRGARARVHADLLPARVLLQRQRCVELLRRCARGSGSRPRDRGSSSSSRAWPRWCGSGAPGTLVSEVAVAAMFIGGATTILTNANPLLPLDGYFALTDWLEIPNLRLRAFAYFGWWIRRHVLRLELPEPTAHRARAPRLPDLRIVVACLHRGAFSGSSGCWLIGRAHQALGAVGGLLAAGLVLLVVRGALADWGRSIMLAWRARRAARGAGPAVAGRRPDCGRYPGCARGGAVDAHHVGAVHRGSATRSKRVRARQRHHRAGVRGRGDARERRRSDCASHRSRARA